MESTPRQDPSVLAVREPAFLSAVTRVLGGQPVLEVRRSVVLKDSDWVMAPVWDYLRTWCHSLLAPPSVEKDPDMMFGKVETSSYNVHLECPGPVQVHECAREEKGMAA